MAWAKPLAQTLFILRFPLESSEGGELNEALVVAKFATPKRYGRRDNYTQVSETTFYNLDVSRLIGNEEEITSQRIWNHKPEVKRACDSIFYMCLSPTDTHSFVTNQANNCILGLTIGELSNDISS